MRPLSAENAGASVAQIMVLRVVAIRPSRTVFAVQIQSVVISVGTKDVPISRVTCARGVVVTESAVRARTPARVLQIAPEYVAEMGSVMRKKRAEHA